MWFENAPWSWMGQLHPSCEPQNLDIGTTWFTTNMGLLYSLESLSYSRPDDLLPTYIPATPYLNNTLQNCTVNQIDIKAGRTSNAQDADVPWIWDNTWATVRHCGHQPFRAKIDRRALHARSIILRHQSKPYSG